MTEHRAPGLSDPFCGSDRVAKELLTRHGISLVKTTDSAAVLMLIDAVAKTDELVALATDQLATLLTDRGDKASAELDLDTAWDLMASVAGGVASHDRVPSTVDSHDRVPSTVDSYDRVPSTVARRLMDRAVAMVPAADRGRYSEEWAADLDEIAQADGIRGQLAWAAGLLWSATMLRAGTRRQPVKGG